MTAVGGNSKPGRQVSVAIVRARIGSESENRGGSYVTFPKFTPLMGKQVGSHADGRNEGTKDQTEKI